MDDALVATFHICGVLAELDRAERRAERFQAETHSWITKALMDAPETVIETRRRCEAQADAIVARIRDAVEAEDGEGGGV